MKKLEQLNQLLDDMDKSETHAEETNRLRKELFELTTQLTTLLKSRQENVENYREITQSIAVKYLTKNFTTAAESDINELEVK